MIKRFNGTFTVEIEQGGIDTVLRCYSYKTLILQTHYRFHKLVENLTFCDLRYYSQTTRIHQGIARALNSYFTAHNGITSEIMRGVRSCDSLRDLKSVYGYISINK